MMVGVRTRTSRVYLKDATVEFLAVLKQAIHVNRSRTRAKRITNLRVKITANACRQTIFYTAIVLLGISDLSVNIKVSRFFMLPFQASL